MGVTDTTAKCNVLTPQGKRCQIPAGLGVEGSLGIGPCHHHRAAEIVVGDDVHETTLSHARKLQPNKEVFRYEMEGDSRLATIMRGMGAEMVVDRARSGVAHLDLDFEMKAMRAMLIMFMERYQEREDALLAWHEAYENKDLSSAPPRNLLSIEMGHKAVVGIAQVAKTMHDIQQSVPRAEFVGILTDMADAVNDIVKDKGERRRIKKQWLQVCAKYVV